MQCSSRASEAYNTNLCHETDQWSEAFLIGNRMETDLLGCLMSLIFFFLNLCYNALVKRKHEVLRYKQVTYIKEMSRCTIKCVMGKDYLG
jgi:hypothetical protein